MNPIIVHREEIVLKSGTRIQVTHFAHGTTILTFEEGAGRGSFSIHLNPEDLDATTTIINGIPPRFKEDAEMIATNPGAPVLT